MVKAKGIKRRAVAKVAVARKVKRAAAKSVAQTAVKAAYLKGRADAVKAHKKVSSALQKAVAGALAKFIKAHEGAAVKKAVAKKAVKRRVAKKIVKAKVVKAVVKAKVAAKRRGRPARKLAVAKAIKAAAK